MFIKCKFHSLIKKDHYCKIATSFAVLLVGSASDCQVKEIYCVYFCTLVCINQNLSGKKKQEYL